MSAMARLECPAADDWTADDITELLHRANPDMRHSAIVARFKYGQKLGLIKRGSGRGVLTTFGFDTVWRAYLLNELHRIGIGPEKAGQMLENEPNPFNGLARFHPSPRADIQIDTGPLFQALANWH